MKALNKRLKRDFKENIGRYGSIIILLIVVIGLISAFFTVGNSAKHTYQTSEAKSNIEDGQFIVEEAIEDSFIQTLEDDYNMTLYQDYYIDYIKDTITYRIYNTRDQVNKATIYQGYLPSKDNEIALDRIFCMNQGLAINDIITINNQDFIISGFVALSDYSSLFKNNTDLMMDTHTFSVAIVSDAGFKLLNQETITYKYSYVFNQDNLSEKKQRETASELATTLYKQGITLSSILVSFDNQGIVFFIEDMGSDVPMMMALYGIFVVIIGFVFSIIIRSTVESEASMIGTLLASGYSKFQLMEHYLTLPVFVTCIGVIVGNICANTFMIDVFRTVYYSAYSLAPMQFHLNYVMVAFTSLLPIGLIVIINGSYLFRVLGITPLRFLRKDLRKHKKRKYRKLPNVSFMNRFRLRVIIQNKASFIVLFAGIFFASFLLMFSLGLTPMFRNFIDEINKSSIPNYQYILKKPIEYQQVEKFNLVSLEFDNYYTSDMMEISIYGIENDSSFYPEIDTTKDGIYLSEGVLKKTNKKIGDSITFYHPYLENKYQFEIVGICDYPSSLVGFISREYFNRSFDKSEDYFSGYFSDQELDIDEKDRSTVITKEDVAAAGQQAISTFSQMTPLLMIASILVYLVVLFILSKVVIDRNALNMSYLKIFGYTNKEVRNVYLTSTLLVVALSLFISLPFIYVGLICVFEFVFMGLNSYIKFNIPIYLYIEIVAIGFVTYFVINLLHVRRINKIDMNDALKDRE